MNSYRCIHIAGTNGKGSTANYIANILTAAGKRCGLFTSPHLLKWQERIRIDGEPIPLDDSYEEKLYDGGYFINTAKLAYGYFEKSNLDYAVIETGIGGKEDITKIFKSDISVITTVAMDHTEILGKTLGEIAYQKAGIIRKGIKVYSHPQKFAARRTIGEQAFMKRCELIYLKKNNISNIRTLNSSILFDLEYRGKIYKDIKISNISKVQTLNASTAFIIAVDEGIDEKVIRKGLLKPIKGRTEVFGNRLVLDVAHNHSSLIELKKTLKETFPNDRFNVMFATQNSKDIKKMAKVINSLAETVFLVDMEDENFYKPKDISNLFKKPHYLSGKQNRLRQSFSYAMKKSKEEKLILVVCGTFRLTGGVYSFSSSV